MSLESVDYIPFGIGYVEEFPEKLQMVFDQSALKWMRAYSKGSGIVQDIFMLIAHCTALCLLPVLPWCSGSSHLRSHRLCQSEGGLLLVNVAHCRSFGSILNTFYPIKYKY